MPKLIERYKSSLIADGITGSLSKGWRKQQDVEWSPRSLSLTQLTEPTAPICYGVVQPGGLVDAGQPLVRVCDLVDGKVDWDQVRTISPHIGEQYKRSAIGTGDILVSIVGTIGRIARVRETRPNANIARAIARIRPNRNIVDPDWLFFALQARELQWNLLNEAREVARKTLNLEQLKAQQILLPSLREQREVVVLLEEKFSRVNQMWEQTLAAEKLLDRLDDATLAKAFRSGFAS